MEQDIQNKKTMIVLPVVHASPVCAFHIARALDALSFDTLFVELPCEAEGLLEALTHADTAAPLSILLRGCDDEYILPLEPYAPEYVAVREAAKRGKRVVFIDSARFVSPVSAPPLSQEAEALVEAAVDMAATENFFLRLEQLAARLAGPATLREQAMAARISAAGACNGVVVAGAAHCAALRTLSGAQCAEAAAGDFECYLIPYIPPALARGVYAYRMLLYERLGKSKDAFFDAAVEVLIRVAARVNKDYPFEQVPLSDIINTLTHARLLASLRGKRYIGAFELTESASSVICKAEEHSVKRAALDAVFQEIPAGSLAPGFATPLVEDFHRRLKELGFRAEAGSRITLNILSNPDHREKSRFLRQLELLDAGFANMKSGAQYAEGKDRNLVREVWKVNSRAQADLRLTYKSHLGATVAQAAQRVLDERLEKILLSDAPELSVCYNRAYFDGLDCGRAFEKLSESVFHLGDFAAAVKTLSSLTYLIEVKNVFEGSRANRDLTVAKMLYARAAAMLPAVFSAQSGEKEAFALAELCGLTASSAYLDPDAVKAALYDAPSFTAPCLYGCIQAILGAASDEERLKSLLLSQSQPSDVGMLVLGMAAGDRGLITRPSFARPLAEYVESLSLEEFLEAAPALRYAFSLLKQSERREVRSVVGTLYGETAPPVSADPALILKDEYLARQLKLYNLKEGDA